MRQSVMKTKALLLLGFSAIVLSACVQVTNTPVVDKAAKVAISSVRDAATQFPQGSNFVIKTHYVDHASTPPAEQEALYTRFGSAISNNFSRHGYQQTADNAQAKFLVGYGVASSNDFSDEKMNEVFGVMPGLQENEGLQKGSFVVYVQDLSTGQRIWRGVAQGFAREHMSEQQRQERAQKTVDTVLAQFYK